MSAYIEIDNIKINNYTFLSTDGGTGNYVISTDGAGNVSFEKTTLSTETACPPRIC